MQVTTETFFRPEEIAHEQVNLPAPLFNRCVLLLNNSPTKNVFVPVRSMQFQAVLDADEIIFVDNQSYAFNAGNGGRLIVIAWKVALHGKRDSLSEPVPSKIIYYANENHETHRRLMGEFPKALDIYEARLKAGEMEGNTATILPFPTGQ